MRGVPVTMATVGALLCAAPALAENTSTLQTAKLDTDFTLCDDAAGSCSDESWHIAVNAKGWTMRATTTFDRVPQDWTESCEDGRYQSDAGGVAWTGTCALSGDPDALCFDVDMSSAEADAAIASQQCFKLLAPHICTMRFTSTNGPLGSTAADPDRAALDLGTVNACIVSEAR